MSIGNIPQKLFELLRNALPPWPDSELPLIRHRPMADDDELEYAGDCLYISCLIDEIMDRLREDGGRPLLPPAIESLDFWQTWDWPDELGSAA